MSVDLHALIDAPMHEVRKVLLENGLWQEFDEETGQPLWSVTVEVERVETEVLHYFVSAPDRDGAERAARVKAKEEDGWTPLTAFARPSPRLAR